MLVEMLRKRDFEVNIEETLVYSFKVEASDEEEAENIISDKFHNGELTLEDGERTEIRIAVDGDGWVSL